MDDARFVATLVRTATAYGAKTANRARVTGFLREGERVVGARVQDVEAGGEYEIRARQVVNATGVWTDDTQAMVGERGQFHVRASKGIHLVVPKDRIHSSTGLILRTEKSVLFVIPWGGTGSSAPRTPTGTSTRPTRPPPARTSTTCWST